MKRSFTDTSRPTTGFRLPPSAFRLPSPDSRFLSRRDFSLALAAAPLAWPASFDRKLLAQQLADSAQRFDPAEQMIAARLGPEYRYHTAQRNRTVHPTRDSIDYALHLLESTGKPNHERAAKILERALPLQEQDPRSKWYGLWGWYMEEPAPQMQPADWNWADFNGAILLLIDARHRAKLSAALRHQVLEAIRHCAVSVRRRNVAMSYTNIAVKGTFVTFAAAERLDDNDLLAYAQDRLGRLETIINGAGSFAEYNSPTYAAVSLVNFARMRMLWKDSDARRRAAALERRLWLHVAEHWDAVRKQFAGPMSRCYSTDIGYPAWLEKGLRGRLGLVTEATLGKASNAGETALHDWRCPDDLVARFLEPPSAPRLRRETYSGNTQGATYLHPAFSLGSVNRGDFWVQRRPVLAWYGTAARPCPHIVLRLVKDDYDFASALLWSVQKDGYLLGLANFRSPGGDRHPSLEPVKDGAFQASRLFLQLGFENLPAEDIVHRKDSSFWFRHRGFRLWCAFRQAVFGPHESRLTSARAAPRLNVDLDLLPAGPARTIRWADTQEAAVSFTLAGEGDSPGDFDAQLRALPYTEVRENGIARLDWQTPAGRLTLEASTRVLPIEQHHKLFVERIDGQPVPVVRLGS